MNSSSRSSAIKKMFSLLESSFGSPLSLFRSADTHKVITLHKTLTSPALTSLLTHKALCVHVKNFIPSSLANSSSSTFLELEKQLKQSGKNTNWKVSTSMGLESSDVHTIGVPSNMSSSSSSSEINPLPSILSSLTKKIISSLSSAHPEGCTSSDTNKIFPRLMHGPTRWRSGFIHVDSLELLSDNEGTFSVNLYLKQPDEGWDNTDPGTLKIWPLKYSRLDFYKNAQTLSQLTTTTSEGQMDLLKKLGQPITIPIEEGDLCLICVQRPHAVTGFKKGSRVSLQGFVEYKRGEGLIVES